MSQAEEMMSKVLGGNTVYTWDGVIGDRENVQDDKCYIVKVSSETPLAELYENGVTVQYFDRATGKVETRVGTVNTVITDVYGILVDDMTCALVVCTDESAAIVELDSAGVYFISTEDYYTVSIRAVGDTKPVSPVAEPHIVIGRDRFITVPADLKRIAVQHDHNVETVTFDCPRYWDGIDMSTNEFAIYINYMLADSSLGSYVAENVSVDIEDENIMHFTWTISENVTKAKGHLMFLVCIKKVEDKEVVVENVVEDEEGNEIIETETVIETVTTNHWNSELNKDLYVSEGLETVEAVSEMTPDFVTKVLTTIDKFDRTVTGQLASDVVKLEGTVLEHTTQISNLQKEVDENKTELQAEIDEDVAVEARKIRNEMDQGDAALRKDVDANSADIDNLTGRMVVAEEIIGAIGGGNVLSVEKGGTGANNAAGALANLGAAPVGHGHAGAVTITPLFLRYAVAGAWVGFDMTCLKDESTKHFRLWGSMIFESAPTVAQEFVWLPYEMLHKAILGTPNKPRTTVSNTVFGHWHYGAYMPASTGAAGETTNPYMHGGVRETTPNGLGFTRIYSVASDTYVYESMPGIYGLHNAAHGVGGYDVVTIYNEVKSANVYSTTAPGGASLRQFFFDIAGLMS